MLTIGEIVALDEQARFRNDVQLSAFRDPAKNMALLRSYLFTGTAPNTEVAGAPYLFVDRSARTGSAGVS